MALEDLISQAILPAGAIGLATGLVRGAKGLETGARPEALEYVSGVLTKGDRKNFGKIGARVVPFVFDKVFRAKPLSLRFITCSIIATTLFWTILLVALHLLYENMVSLFQLGETKTNILYLLPLWNVID